MEACPFGIFLSWVYLLVVLLECSICWILQIAPKLSDQLCAFLFFGVTKPFVIEGAAAIGKSPNDRVYTSMA